jgi:hypothetical protein
MSSTATSSVSWITATRNNNTPFLITVSRNTGAWHSGTVTIKDGSKTTIYTINQGAAPTATPVPTSTTIQISKECDAEGGSFYAANSTMSSTATPSESWITATRTNNTPFLITVSRSDGVLRTGTLTIKDGNKTIIYTILQKKSYVRLTEESSKLVSDLPIPDSDGYVLPLTLIGEPNTCYKVRINHDSWVWVDLTSSNPEKIEWDDFGSSMVVETNQYGLATFEIIYSTNKDSPSNEYFSANMTITKLLFGQYFLAPTSVTYEMRQYGGMPKIIPLLIIDDENGYPVGDANAFKETERNHYECTYTVTSGREAQIDVLMLDHNSYIKTEAASGENWISTKNNYRDELYGFSIYLSPFMPRGYVKDNEPRDTLATDRTGTVSFELDGDFFTIYFIQEKEHVLKRYDTTNDIKAFFSIPEYSLRPEGLADYFYGYKYTKELKHMNLTGTNSASVPEYYAIQTRTFEDLDGEYFTLDYAHYTVGASALEVGGATFNFVLLEHRDMNVSANYVQILGDTLTGTGSYSVSATNLAQAKRVEEIEVTMNRIEVLALGAGAFVTLVTAGLSLPVWFTFAGVAGDVAIVPIADEVKDIFVGEERERIRAETGIDIDNFCNNLYEPEGINDNFLFCQKGDGFTATVMAEQNSGIQMSVLLSFFGNNNYVGYCTRKASCS